MTDNPRNDDIWALAARMADMERRLALVERRADNAEQALLEVANSQAESAPIHDLMRPTNSRKRAQ